MIIRTVPMGGTFTVSFHPAWVGGGGFPLLFRIWKMGWGGGGGGSFLGVLRVGRMIHHGHVPDLPNLYRAQLRICIHPVGIERFSVDNPGDAAHHAARERKATSAHRLACAQLLERAKFEGGLNGVPLPPCPAPA